MELKKKLSQLRKEKGLTQLELAEALNVSRQAVSRWEVGSAFPTLDNLMSLSQVFGVPLDDLVRCSDSNQEVSEEVPMMGPLEPVPADTARSHTTLIVLLLAVLILGVGILIGINLARKTQVSETGQNERVIISDPEAWLERTPTDIEDELEWLETMVKDLEKALP